MVVFAIATSYLVCGSPESKHIDMFLEPLLSPVVLTVTANR